MAPRDLLMDSFLKPTSRYTNNTDWTQPVREQSAPNHSYVTRLILPYLAPDVGGDLVLNVGDVYDQGGLLDQPPTLTVTRPLHSHSKSVC